MGFFGVFWRFTGIRLNGHLFCLSLTNFVTFLVTSNSVSCLMQGVKNKQIIRSTEQEETDFHLLGLALICGDAWVEKWNSTSKYVLQRFLRPNVCISRSDLFFAFHS